MKHQLSSKSLAGKQKQADELAKGNIERRPNEGAKDERREENKEQPFLATMASCLLS